VLDNLIRIEELWCQLGIGPVADRERGALVQVQPHPVPQRKLDMMVISIMRHLHVSLGLKQPFLDLR
jgi:hypothetical protein